MDTKSYDETDPQDIERHARRLIGHSIREVADTQGLVGIGQETTSTAKGGFGMCLERFYFKIKPRNDDGTPDFKAAGVELKSSPLLRKGGRFVAKERMVLGMINYHKLREERDFESSSFWSKNRRLLTVFYLHRKDVSVLDLKVELAGLLKIPPRDLQTIKEDWAAIQQMVVERRAEELHEGMTRYLGACTKGPNSDRWVGQTGTTTLAKPRAFAYKQGYVNNIIGYLSGAQTSLDDLVIKDPEEQRAKTFDGVFIDRFRPYLGMDVLEIAQMFGIKNTGNAKNFNDMVSRGILRVKKHIEEFDKADITLRSITLDNDGRLKEHVSFPAFDYFELEREKDWETSSIREMFTKRFFFVIYQKDGEGKKRLRKVMFWSIPARDLEEVEKVWDRAKECIRRRDYAELPKVADNRVSHIRPHGRNSQDMVDVPGGGRQVKRCFWLNREYVAGQVG